MADIEHQLKQKLYRVFCPDALELSEYASGKLKRARIQEIRRHLKQCPHCTRELSLLKEFIASVSEDLQQQKSGFVNPINVWIAQLISPSPFSGAAPAMGMRGAEQNVLQYQAGDAQISLEIQDDLDQAGAWAIIGLVSGVLTTVMRAYLWQDGRLVAETPIDELGNIAFSGLAPGAYDLIIGAEAVEIHVQNFQV